MSMHHLFPRRRHLDLFPRSLKKTNVYSSAASSQSSASSDELSPFSHQYQPYHLEGIVPDEIADIASLALADDTLFLPDPDLWSPASLLDDTNSWLDDLNFTLPMPDSSPMVYSLFDAGPSLPSEDALYVHSDTFYASVLINA
jgi:hypothetical protein